MMTKFEIDYTQEDMKAFFEDTAKKKMLINLISTYSVIGLVLFFLFVVISYIIKDTFRLIPIVFLGIYVVLVALAIIRTINDTPKKMYNKFSESYDGNTVICCFDEEKIYIGSISDEDIENTDNKDGVVLYSSLKKVIETDNYFYVFVNSMTAQIVKKSAIVEGSIEEVRSYLKSVSGLVYDDLKKYR